MSRFGQDAPLFMGRPTWTCSEPQPSGFPRSGQCDSWRWTLHQSQLEVLKAPPAAFPQSTLSNMDCLGSSGPKHGLVDPSPAQRPLIVMYAGASSSLPQHNEPMQIPFRNQATTLPQVSSTQPHESMSLVTPPQSPGLPCPPGKKSNTLQCMAVPVRQAVQGDSAPGYSNYTTEKARLSARRRDFATWSGRLRRLDEDCIYFERRLRARLADINDRLFRARCHGIKPNAHTRLVPGPPYGASQRRFQ